jgi:phospholipid/cholesterol/gamma-HCH transport system ATP-binding protein
VTVRNPIISVRGLRNRFGEQIVHNGLDLDVQAGEIIGVVGGSGTGKSVLMRSILGLQPFEAGEIELLGRRTNGLDDDEWQNLQKQYGVLFQNGALFSSLNVTENIQVPLREHARLDKALMAEIAAYKLAMVGLGPEAASKLPSALSGGMRKRAALARALALDPKLLFLDEPTAGLDPIGAAAFDILIRDLSKALGLTVFLITHDLDTLHAICDRVAVLADHRVLIAAPIIELLSHPHPWIQEYFNGPRGRAAQPPGAARDHQ